jgi:hypothetical protein
MDDDQIISIIGSNPDDIKVLRDLNLPIEYFASDPECLTFLVPLLSPLGNVRLRFFIKQQTGFTVHSTSSPSTPRPAKRLPVAAVERLCAECDERPAGFAQFQNSIFCSTECKTAHRNRCKSEAAEKAAMELRDQLLEELQKSYLPGLSSSIRTSTSLPFPTSTSPSSLAPTHVSPSSLTPTHLALSSVPSTSTANEPVILAADIESVRVEVPSLIWFRETLKKDSRFRTLPALKDLLTASGWTFPGEKRVTVENLRNFLAEKFFSDPKKWDTHVGGPNK